MSKTYVLTSNTFHRVSKMCGSLNCERCGQPLKVGERVFKRNVGGRVKRYHPKCWESMFIEVST